VNKNVYEIITIFSPTILEEKVETHLKRIREIISNHKGEILAEDHWDNKKLAYRINKFNSGIYHFIKAEVLPTFVVDFKRYVSANEEIIRNSVIKIEKKLLKPTQKNLTKESLSEQKQELEPSISTEKPTVEDSETNKQKVV
jgi:small subunit ribosomal protein S6